MKLTKGVRKDRAKDRKTSRQVEERWEKVAKQDEEIKTGLDESATGHKM